MAIPLDPARREKPVGWKETLLQAVETRDLMTLHALARNAVNMNTPFADGTLPLFHALSIDDFVVGEALIAFGADVYARNSAGRTELEQAILENKELFAKMLLRRGADLNASENGGRIQLYSALEIQKRYVQAVGRVKGTNH